MGSSPSTASGRGGYPLRAGGRAPGPRLTERQIASVAAMPLPEQPIAGDLGTLTELFDVVVEQAGEVEAFVDGDRRITFAEWARAADGVATRLASMGVGPGDI